MIVYDRVKINLNNREVLFDTVFEAVNASTWLHNYTSLLCTQN